MSRFPLASTIVCVVAASFLTGCAGRMLRKPPIDNQVCEARPEELARLAPFLGWWQDSIEMKVPGFPRPIKSVGETKGEWACDKRVLVEHREWDLGDDGTMSFIVMRTWDERSRAFRIWWFDSRGGIATGTESFDPADDAWHVQLTARDCMASEQFYSEGTRKMLDPDTVQSHWKRWPGSRKSGQPVELSITSKRK